MTNDILSQVRAMKESGEIDDIIEANPDIPGPYAMADMSRVRLLARFALMVLEQKPSYYVVRRVFNDKFGPEVELDAYETELDANKNRDDHGGFIQPTFTLPPVPAPDDVELQARLAASHIMELICRPGVHYSVYDLKSIIASAIKGEV